MAADCLLRVCSKGSCYSSHKAKSALNPDTAPFDCSTFDCRVARGVGGLGLVLGS
jgi:hypothetical protein